MPAVAIIGCQWGDEGKGKITDLFAERADMIVRYQGGNNAGHTVIVGDEVYKLHLLPAGIVSGKPSVIGNGVVIDPAVLVEEMEALKQRGVDTSSLRISERAHVIMPYHKLLDSLEEQSRGQNRIGTTGRGIGPAYVDKIARSGVRVVDLLDADQFSARLDQVLPGKNKVLTAVYGEKPLRKEQIMDEYLSLAEKFAPLVIDATTLVNDAVDSGKKVLFEGAQGTLLDIDHGTYPFVTSSSPTAGGIAVGTGVAPGKLDRVIGVAKAYTTRVGEGPFPSEEPGPAGEQIRKQGNEYGTTTGRPRRCGWFDAVIVSYAVRVNGCYGLALNCLDVLDGFDTVKICVEYRLNNQPVESFPCDQKRFARVEPVYEELPGWPAGTSSAKSFSDLHPNLRQYISRIEELTGVPVVSISVGPKRNQTIIRQEPFSS